MSFQRIVPRTPLHECFRDITMLNESNRVLLTRLWSRFFPLERPGSFTGPNKDPRISIIETFASILCKSENAFLFKNVTWGPGIPVYFDVQELSVVLQFPDFVSMLRTKPREVVGCLGIALSIFAAERVPSAAESAMPWLIRPCFLNLGDETPYELLKSSCVGQFVCFKGHVVRVSASHPLVIGGSFVCSKCNKDTWQDFEDGVYCEPEHCKTPSCRSKMLTLRRNQVTTQEYQTIRMQVRSPHCLLYHLCFSIF